MNHTNWEHAIFALIGQIVIFLITGSWWLGAIGASGFFLGREHAQFEYKIGNPSTLNPLEGFQFWKWNLDSKLDSLFPVVSTFGLATIMTQLS
jgi:hypothetical protein